ncbi:MAG: hypothetical protein AAFZ89_11500 [Bacteroidota bacterium]
MKTPKIVPVPEKMQKYYGSGRMLHPELEMVKDVINNIPKGKVATLNELTRKLAEVHGADVTCPMRTGNHLKRISKNMDLDTTAVSIPFWRVIRTNGMMMKIDNYEFWAIVLEKEGFVLEYMADNIIKVIVPKDQLYSF